MASFYQLASLILVFLIQIILFFTKGYFLSIEFTLYPYLSSNGFLPYKNIIDQHLPSLFFGPFSLPLLSTHSPLPLTVVFLAILFFTNLLLFLYLKKRGLKNPVLWVFAYALLSFYFSGNVLWVETFVTFLLSIYLYFGLFRKSWINFILGLLLSQIILMRPTILPALFFLVLATEINLSLIIGGVVGMALPLFYLFYHNLWNSFWQTAIVFNREVYPFQAKIIPNLRQIILVSIVLLPSLVTCLRKKGLIWSLSLTLMLILAYPRFGFEHLQPFILISTITLASQSKNSLIPIFYILLFSIFNLSSTLNHHYGNYFYQPNIIKIAEEIKSSDQKFLYLFGASDLMYPLSGKLPPQQTYLPSLPWYLHYPQYKDLLLSSLDTPDTLIVVDTNFEVDNVKLVDSSQELYNYIKINFKQIKTSGSYEFYIKP